MTTHAHRTHLHAQETVAKTVLAAAQAKHLAAQGRLPHVRWATPPAARRSDGSERDTAGDAGRVRRSLPLDHARYTMSSVSAHGTADHTASVVALWPPRAVRRVTPLGRGAPPLADPPRLCAVAGLPAEDDGVAAHADVGSAGVVGARAGGARDGYTTSA